MKVNSYKGHTLLNLLGVAVILLVAAAILFPLFAPPRKRSYCQSNLKQIGLGYFQYMQDYNDTLPPIGKVSALHDSGWPRVLLPYMKSDMLFKCSEDDFDQDTKPRSVQYTDYYFNSNFAGKNTNKIKHPSEVIFLGDGEASSSNYACSKLSSCTGLNNTGLVGAVPQSAFDRHFDGSNFAFGDGHVKWLSKASLTANGSEKKLFGF